MILHFLDCDEHALPLNISNMLIDFFLLQDILLSPQKCNFQLLYVFSTWCGKLGIHNASQRLTGCLKQLMFQKGCSLDETSEKLSHCCRHYKDHMGRHGVFSLDGLDVCLFGWESVNYVKNLSVVFVYFPILNYWFAALDMCFVSVTLWPILISIIAWPMWHLWLKVQCHHILTCTLYNQPLASLHSMANYIQDGCWGIFFSNKECHHERMQTF